MTDNLLSFSYNVLIANLHEIYSFLNKEIDKNVESIDNMRPWPKSTNQTELMIRSDSILTIADPTKAVIDRYLELTKS